MWQTKYDLAVPKNLGLAVKVISSLWAFVVHGLSQAVQYLSIYVDKLYLKYFFHSIVLTPSEQLKGKKLVKLFTMSLKSRRSLSQSVFLQSSC